MKKRILSVFLFITMLLVTFSFSACKGSSNEAYPEKFLVFDSNGNAGTIWVGMPKDYLRGRFEFSPEQDVLGNYFLQDKSGNIVLVGTTPKKITSIELIPAKSSRSESDLQQLREGMTLSEVTRIIGAPDTPSPYSGFYATGYYMDDGQLYKIIWNTYPSLTLGWISTAASDDNSRDSVTVIDDSQNEVTVSIGTPYETFTSNFSNSILDKRNIGFFKTPNGETVLISFQWSEKAHRVSKIEVFEPRDHLPSEAEFNQVTRGMTISEVTALIGVPYNIPMLSGLYCYQYMLDDGTIRTISWYYTSESMIVN